MSAVNLVLEILIAAAVLFFLGWSGRHLLESPGLPRFVWIYRLALAFALSVALIGRNHLAVIQRQPAHNDLLLFELMIIFGAAVYVLGFLEWIIFQRHIYPTQSSFSASRIQRIWLWGLFIVLVGCCVRYRLVGLAVGAGLWLAGMIAAAIFMRLSSHRVTSPRAGEN